MTTGELDPNIKIRAPLRCDGIGRLDCAEDVGSGMRMAIRWLPLEANGDAAARAVNQLPPHPTLPRIRQTGRVGSAAYVAMDFPEGQLLSTLVGEPQPVEALRRVGADIADALATLHAQADFHGELSADSLLLLPSGKAILWDMPLVVANRLTDRRGEERLMSQLVRMAPFLAPERARGMPPSAAADVYALGAVLCLAGGGRPPPGASTLAIVHQLASGLWSPEVPQGYPPEVRTLLGRMVARDPLARPSARAVAEQLCAPLQERTQVDVPVVTPEPVPAPSPDKVMLVVGAATATLIAGFAAVVTYFILGQWSNPPAPVEPPAVSRPAPRVDPPPSQPAPAEESAADEELLVPLTPAPRVEKPARLPRKAPTKADAQAEEPTTPPIDFGFLETGVERPKSELKRPSF